MPRPKQYRSLDELTARQIKAFEEVEHTLTEIQALLQAALAGPDHKTTMALRQGAGRLLHKTNNVVGETNRLSLARDHAARETAET